MTQTRPLSAKTAAALGLYTPASRFSSVAKGIHALISGNRDLVRDDPLAAEVAKTATLPLTTSTASAVAGTVISSVVDLLGVTSAFRQIAAPGSGALLLSYDRYAKMVIPTATRSGGTNVKFVGEGEPAPVGALAISGPEVSKQKVVLLTALSREVAEGSNGLTFIRQALSENLDVGLDTILLDDQEGTEVRPQGLRYGVSATTASVATDPHAAMIEDLAALGAAVCAVGGSNLIYIMAVPEWLKVQLWAPQLRLPIYPSGGLSAGQVLCVAPSALAFVGSDQPVKIEISNEAVLHMDTVPQAITSEGTPNVIAYPTLSAFQTDATVIKLRAEMSWALRVESGAVSWTENTGW